MIIALLLAEVMVRIFFPISDGRENVTLEGKPIKEWFQPDSVYRQVSSEYDALTTITHQGHRVPGVTDNPDVIFLGDSFTYGWGLDDKQTFASIYCTQLKVKCANLGRPGSGTEQQVKRLQEFLDKWNWRPREVKLFFFAMSTSFSAGNDFVDNYYHGRWLKSQSSGKAVKTDENEVGLMEKIINLRVVLQQQSYLVRFLKFHLGGWLRSLAIAEPGNERMTEALGYTQTGLQKLDALSHKYGFTYKIYLLVPVQDIIRGTYSDTLETLNNVSPQPAISTAQLFVDSPSSYYFPYDGHLNPKGSRKIGEFLVSKEE
jgi:hypothetical protein